MAAIAKVGNPSLSSTKPPVSDLVGGLSAGAAIAAGDVIELRSDGFGYPAAPAASGHRRIGIAFTGADITEPVTYVIGKRFNYGSGLTPGALVYLSATVAGGLDTVVNGSEPAVGYCVDATRIQFYDRLD